MESPLVSICGSLHGRCLHDDTTLNIDIIVKQIAVEGIWKQQVGAVVLLEVPLYGGSMSIHSQNQPPTQNRQRQLSSSPNKLLAFHP